MGMKPIGPTRKAMIVRAMLAIIGAHRMVRRERDGIPLLGMSLLSRMVAKTPFRRAVVVEAAPHRVPLQALRQVHPRVRRQAPSSVLRRLRRRRRMTLARMGASGPRLRFLR